MRYRSFYRIKDLISSARGDYRPRTPAMVRNHGKPLPQEGRVLAALRAVPAPGWTTQPALAAALKLGNDTVYRCLKSLKGKGLAEVEKGRGTRAVPPQKEGRP